MNHRRTTVLACMLIAAFVAFDGSAQSIPSLINYQGKLTDASGSPLPNGTYGVAFCIWNKKDAAQPGNTLIWGQEYSVAVQSGVFNVILGAPGGVPITNAAVNDLTYAFTEAERYVGLTVTRGTNGIAIPSAGEIIPRQQILSTPYALHANFAATATNLVTFPIPRGVVVMWSGTLGTIPAGWALCDGQNGTPDLRDKFMVCARQDDAAVPKSSVSGSLTQTGGQATHTNTMSEMPAHHHYSFGENYPDWYFGSYGGPNYKGSAGGTDNDNHLLQTTDAGQDPPQPFTILPPYYAIAYIMKL